MLSGAAYADSALSQAGLGKIQIELPAPKVMKVDQHKTPPIPAIGKESIVVDKNDETGVVDAVLPGGKAVVCRYSRSFNRGLLGEPAYNCKTEEINSLGVEISSYNGVQKYDTVVVSDNNTVWVVDAVFSNGKAQICRKGMLGHTCRVKGTDILKKAVNPQSDRKLL